MARKAVYSFLACVAVLWLTPGLSASAAPQRLHGHVPAVVSQLLSVGRAESAQRLNLSIGLPLRNAEALNALLQQIYDPASPFYRHYLTPAQFTERFGPTEQDYQAVIAFAKTAGLTVTCTHPDRVVLDVEGAVTDIEKAFRVALRVYQHPREARTFYAPDADPSLDLSIPVLHISGLDNYALRKPKLHPVALNQEGKTAPHSGSGGSYIGGDFRAAYAPGVSLTGAGQSVGLLQFDAYYASDITAYETLAGLPNVTLTNVLINGVVNPGSGSSEVSLDIEMVMSMAPGISQIIVYEAPLTASWESILSRMADDNLAQQLSCSWGDTSPGSPDPTAEQIFQQMAAQGQSFFNATGDSDAFTKGIPFPSESTNVTQVGGTTLTTSGPKGAYVSETVWNWGGGTGSSGGISANYAIPYYQQGLSMTANQGSTTMRNVPDVALTADNVWVLYGNGKSGAFGGTSCAAPLWAGFIALVNQQAAATGQPPVGFINPAVYAIGKGSSYAATFHDTTTGNNFDTSSPTKYAAVAGYDLCTGWGTPNGSNLIAALSTPPDALVISPFTGFTATGAVGGPFTPLTQTLSLTNVSATALTWSVSNPAAWLSVSPGGGALAGHGSAAVTASVTSAANALTAGVYAANVVFTDLSSGAARPRPCTLAIGQSIVQNGGFETGDFTHWTLSGYTSRMSVYGSSTYAHSGTYGARLRSSTSSFGYLAQTLQTTPGQTYCLSFWMNIPNTLTEFRISWNGNVLLDRTNIPSSSWTNLQFLVAASNAATALQFGLRSGSYFGLDDVSAVPTNPFARTLTVISAGGGAAPGTLTTNYGATVTEWITNSPEVNGLTQYVCTGGSVAGAAFTQASATNVTLSLTNNVTLTWLWSTNYWFSGTSAANGTVTGATDGWYALGSSVTVTATPSAYFHFAGWTGDVPSVQSNSNPLTAPMDQPRSVTATFGATLESLGTPDYWLAAHGLTNFASAELSDPDGDGMATWQEYVADTDPTNRASCLRVLALSNLPPWTVWFGSSTARVYALQFSTNLALSNGWVDVAGPSNNWGSGGAKTLSDTNAPGPSFYRVQVQAPP